MINSIADNTGKVVEFEMVNRIVGVKTRPDGFVEPSYNWEAIEGWELDADGNRTGKYVYGARNSGSTSEWSYKEDCWPTIEDWLGDWDNEYVDEFRAEGLLPPAITL